MTVDPASLEPDELQQVRERAEEALGRFPGVQGVSFGLRETGGVVTEQRSFRVYVTEKRAEADLSPDEVLPTEFEGIPVDVLEVREIEEVHCEDIRQHHPLIGGITITGFRAGSGSEIGTLGFFATVNGASGPKNVVLVSNHHVLMANGASVGNTIYQPSLVDGPIEPGLADTPEARRAIAEINDAGIKGNHSFAYPSETAQDYYVDAASALLAISISSWCNSNCGVSYKNEIRQLDIGGNSKLEDVVRVTQTEVLAPGDYVVHKVGRTTSKTVGKIIDAEAVSASGGMRIIEIEATQNDCNGILQFVAGGDSGSALVNAQNKLVGLVFGKGAGALGNRGYASHIHPVMDKLKVTPITSANPPVGPAGQTRNDRMARIGTEEDLSVRLREQARRTSVGAALFEMFEAHREEILGLVNYHRPVTIAWHRGKGPAYLAHLAENARVPSHHVPHEVDGVGRRELLERMETALTASGSEPLRRAIREHRETLLALVDDFDDLHELVGRFEERPAHV